MSEQQSIRDEAVDLFENVLEKSRRLGIAATPAILANELLASPVIRRIQADALRDAANWKRAHNLEHSVWGDYLLHLAQKKYEAGGDDMITIWLNDRADRIQEGAADA